MPLSKATILESGCCPAVPKRYGVRRMRLTHTRGRGTFVSAKVPKAIPPKRGPPTASISVVPRKASVHWGSHTNHPWCLYQPGHPWPGARRSAAHPARFAALQSRAHGTSLWPVARARLLPSPLRVDFARCGARRALRVIRRRLKTGVNLARSSAWRRLKGIRASGEINTRGKSPAPSAPPLQRG